MNSLTLFSVLALAACVTFSCGTEAESSADAARGEEVPGSGQAAADKPGEADNTLSPEEKNERWVLLFNGKSMEHWRGFKKKGVPDAWKIVDGAMVLTGKGGGDLVTKDEYRNFELMLDWKISEGGNSGIFFNVSEDPKFDYTWQTGPELQILDDERHPDAKLGKNNNRHAGTNYDLHPLSTPAVKPAGEYNRVRLVVKDGHVAHYLNGRKVVAYTLWSPEWEALVKGSKFAGMPDYGRYQQGHIALQDHGDKVWFKNIKIRSLE